MDVDSLFKYKNKNKVKAIKVTEEGYAIIMLLVKEANVTNVPNISRLGAIPLVIDNSIKNKFEVIYDE